jgi:hypothetical protein
MSTYRFPIGASCFEHGSKVLKGRLKTSQKLSLPIYEERKVLRARPQWRVEGLSVLLRYFKEVAGGKTGNELQ